MLASDRSESENAQTVYLVRNQWFGECSPSIFALHYISVVLHLVGGAVVALCWLSSLRLLECDMEGVSLNLLWAGLL
jgi:hypothetical protein